MRKFVVALTAAALLSSNFAYAGGMAEPVVEPEIVEGAGPSSGSGLLVPLLLILVAGAVIAGAGTSGDCKGSRSADIDAAPPICK